MACEKLVVSIEESARLLGISRPTAYLLAKKGQLPVLRLGRRLVIPKKALEDFLACIKPNGQPQGES
jgi:excisionase family DNA binding protein